MCILTSLGTSPSAPTPPEMGMHRVMRVVKHHQRCAALQAVRAMRFDPGAHKPKDKLPTERTMTDAEVAKAIEEAESEEP